MCKYVVVPIFTICLLIYFCMFKLFYVLLHQINKTTSNKITKSIEL